MNNLLYYIVLMYLVVFAIIFDALIGHHYKHFLLTVSNYVYHDNVVLQNPTSFYFLGDIQIFQL